jgi:ATP-dependent helicase HrpB
MKQKIQLPIDPFIDQIVKDSQDYSTLLIKASPGSGKTTRLPWAIAQKSQKNVLVLEPRRLAAKLAATRIADEENLRLGEEIGYHFRFENKTSAKTRLTFYTEGTFLKRLLNDPQLSDVSVVILDEFHERHLETDVSLAALMSLQKKRLELKIILMSATLETNAMERFVHPKLFEITAPNFPVSLHYLPNQPSVLGQTLEQKVKKTLEHIDSSHDTLVFVPGMREMVKVSEALGASYGEVFFLHADLEKEDQERALLPSQRRKIILATNIAESSVTIPGIKAVIDSGIQRELVYSPWNGLSFLEDHPITKSSAIQRAGRAGRTSAGACFRLYAEMDFNEREDHTVPEILKADLTDTVLLSARMKNDLHWYTSPPEARWKKSQELARKLGALNETNLLSTVGEKILNLPLDTRLSRTLIAASEYTKVEKKKLLQFISEQIENDRSGTLVRRMNDFLSTDGKDNSPFEKALLAGFIDQVARFRLKQHDFIHSSGKTLKIHPDLKSLHHDFYLVLDISKRHEAVLVVPIEEEWLYEIDPFPFTEDEDIENGKLKRRTKLGSIVMDETILPLEWEKLSRETKDKILLSSATPFKKKLDEWKETTYYGKLVFWSKYQKLLLENAIDALSAEEFFNAGGALNFNHVEDYFRLNIETRLELKNVDRLLPNAIDLGGRREIHIHYPTDRDPYIEAHIQDFYGQKKTPTILDGKFALTLNLIGPDRKPMQITRDLVNFWAKTYHEMKKEYSRDYPRHYWPDKPEDAKPLLLKRHLTEKS